MSDLDVKTITTSLVVRKQIIKEYKEKIKDLKQEGLAYLSLSGPASLNPVFDRIEKRIKFYETTIDRHELFIKKHSLPI